MIVITLLGLHSDGRSGVVMVAKVLSASADGFVSEHVIDFPVGPDEVYVALT